LAIIGGIAIAIGVMVLTFAVRETVISACNETQACHRASP